MSPSLWSFPEKEEACAGHRQAGQKGEACQPPEQGWCRLLPGPAHPSMGPGHTGQHVSRVDFAVTDARHIASLPCSEQPARLQETRPHGGEDEQDP